MIIIACDWPVRVCIAPIISALFLHLWCLWLMWIYAIILCLISIFICLKNLYIILQRDSHFMSVFVFCLVWTNRRYEYITRLCLVCDAKETFVCTGSRSRRRHIWMHKLRISVYSAWQEIQWIFHLRFEVYCWLFTVTINWHIRHSYLCNWFVYVSFAKAFIMHISITQTTYEYFWYCYL